MLRTTSGFHRSVQLGLTALLAALLLGNPIVLYAGLLVFVLLAVELASAHPTVAFETGVPDERKRRGDELEVEVRGRFGGGLGRIHVHLPLPDEVELVEGTNYRVFPVAPWSREVSWTMTLGLRKRGEVEVGALEVESVSLLGTAAVDETLASAVEVAVQPRQQVVDRVREIDTVGRMPYPEQASAPVGVRTGDFEDIRKYQKGDPKKWINWRATAKHLSQGGEDPLVNQYEIEGKHAVWLFIDASQHMELGTDVDNVFEHVAEAAVGIASYYLDQGYKVGLTVHPQMRLLNPDVGRNQTHRVITELTQVGLDRDGDAGLPEAVEATRRFIATERPLCFVLTRPEADPDGVETAVKRLRGIMGRRAGILVVSVDWSAVHPWIGPGEELQRSLAGIRAEHEREALDALGAAHVTWNPEEQPFGAFLSQSVTKAVRTR